MKADFSTMEAKFFILTFVLCCLFINGFSQKPELLANYIIKLGHNDPPSYVNSILYDDGTKAIVSSAGRIPNPLPAKFTIDATDIVNVETPALKIIAGNNQVGIDVNSSISIWGTTYGSSLTTAGPIIVGLWNPGISDFLGPISAPYYSVGNNTTIGKLETDSRGLEFYVNKFGGSDHAPSLMKVLNINYQSVQVTGVMTTDELRILSGAGANRVLVSDEEGVGRWTPMSVLNDNDWIRSRENNLFSNCRRVGIGIDPFKPEIDPDSKLYVITGDERIWATKIINTSREGRGLLIQGGKENSGQVEDRIKEPKESIGVPLLEIQGDEGRSLFFVNKRGYCGIGSNELPATLDVDGNIIARQGIYGSGTSHIPPFNGKLMLFGSSDKNAANISLGEGINDRSLILTSFSETGEIQNKVNDTIRMKVKSDLVTIGNANAATGLLVNGVVSIGGPPPAPGCDSHKLFVRNGITTEEVLVKLNGEWCDYVFDEDYPLLALPKVEQFISSNHHLPEIPSAAQIKKDGINLGKMDAQLLKKIEELTLYIIQQQKQIDLQQTEIKAIRDSLTR
jgi:hypothetical protein